MSSTIHSAILLSTVVLCTSSGFPQNKTIDSLRKELTVQKEDTGKVNTLTTLSAALRRSNDYTNANQYANTALTLAEKLNFPKGKADAYNILGNLYVDKGDYPGALKNYSEALKHSKEIDFKAGIAESHFGLGASYGNLDNKPEALKHLYSSLQLYEEIGDNKQRAFCLATIGFVYYGQEDYQQSLNAFADALKIYQETGLVNSYGGGHCYIFIANIYRIQKKYAEALNYDSIGLKISMAIGNNQMAANAYSSIGDILSQQINFSNSLDERQVATLKEALKNYHKSLDNFRIVPDMGGMGDSYQHIAEISIALHDFPKAQKYADSALHNAKQINFKDNLSKAYLVQAKIDEAKGDYKKAYQQYQLYILYRDSIINDESTRRNTQVRLQYDFDKKEAAARAAQERKDDATKRTRNIQYFVTGLFLTAGIFLYIYGRQKQKAKVKVEKAYSQLKSAQAQLIQSEKMASLGELTAGIAHEIQNPLNFVNNFSEVNKELLTEMKDEIDKGNLTEVKTIANDVIENQEKINHHGKRADAIVKGMLQHSRTSSGQKEPTDINALADEYLRLAYHGLRAKDKSLSAGQAGFNAKIETDFDNNIGKINIIPRDIGRVILNVINNAFYAACLPPPAGGGFKDPNYKHDPSIWVSTKKLDGKIEISVKDNGPGIPQKILDKIFQPFFTTKPTGQGTGLGLSLAYDIVKAHGGELKVETKEGEGAEFIIQLPLS